VHRVFNQDRSYITSVITALVLMASCHAAWHIIRNAKRIHAATVWLQTPVELGVVTISDDFLSEFIDDVETLAQNRLRQNHQDIDNNAQTLFDIHSDRLRGAADVGWFLVDLAIKLGLLGTIIGFILIFTSLNSTTINGAEGLQDLLVSMSGGMGTALFTTLTGLIGSTILSAQYLVLGRETEHLLGLLQRLQQEVTSVPTLIKHV